TLDPPHPHGWLGPSDDRQPGTDEELRADTRLGNPIPPTAAPHRISWQAAPMSLVLRTAAYTDIGLGRSNNEDSAAAGLRLAVVADGIGGMPAGEQASAVVVRQLCLLDPDAALARPLPDTTP